ncbi:putative helicase [Octadecabacter antarcticus 307]|uniref:Putative helicase n=1 Tax=Octadecabacter antarcticus 307 TaxID=391626 RepID=M9RBC6_9RHOB|nr:DEAD/DEAH box helicase [Octadecabacter antarcticus]AGI69899.1 putative helicase [Octadecabacter antarcticus 307]
MAFKTNISASTSTTNPAAHFKTLTKRQYPDVMPHQKDILEAYASDFADKSDVALQLPTGSGKTLVGLLIADWRRQKFGDRAVYLCPTRQLVNQTVNQALHQYGIDVVDLSGSTKKFAPADKTDFITGAKVAVSTYSGLFNTHPFFEDPDLIIVDDAHAAENYIANMWSLGIAAGTTLHLALSKFLHQHLDPQDHSRLTGDWIGSADANWVEKLSTPLVTKLEAGLSEIVDGHADIDTDAELYFKWSLLRGHLDACHVYLGSREILIRPLIPPTSTHAPFANAGQRIFMSATLGKGGDLERLTGRKAIDRLKAPDGFQNAGVGRRFFIFPSLSLTGDQTDGLRLAMQERSGRSLILTPSDAQAKAHTALVEKHLEDYEVFDKDDIELNKAPFVASTKAVAILANRFDGIDFPGDECRLLCVDGLPKAMNSQERFIMSKMGATALFNERIQTRILQAVGRCTRALQDRSAVLVTGVELVDFLADNRKWKHFHPELQAELTFGLDQSKNVTAESIFDNFDMFLKNGSDWSGADGMIRNSIGTFVQADFPAMDDLAKVAPHEVSYQEAIWNKNFTGALAEAKTILTHLNHSDLRGYRALWHYLAGSIALRLSESDLDAQAVSARLQFSKSRSAAPSISWLNALSRDVSGLEDEAGPYQNTEVLKQVEALEQQFLTMGTINNIKFEKRAAKIQGELSQANTFEAGQVALGTLLGFSAGNDESDAAPDPWWLGDKIGVVFEAHADGNETTVFGATKARQAAGHPKWIRKNVAGANELEVSPILATPCKTAKSGAEPHLEDVGYWELSSFRAWALHAVNVLRELKGTFPGEGDLIWRDEAVQKLISDGLSLEAIRSDRPMASAAMTIVA